MTEFKEDWKFDQNSGLINKDPSVSYHAHVKNLRNTILAHSRKAMVSPRVRLVEQNAKMEKMLIVSTPLHTANCLNPYGALKTGFEDPELEALLSKVSPKYRQMSKMKDMEYYKDLFIPKITRK